MAKLLQLRRGTLAQHAAFNTGEQGEVTVDTTLNTLVVHDGTSSGGTQNQGGYRILSEENAKTFGDLHDGGTHTTGGLNIDLRNGSNQVFTLNAPISTLDIEYGFKGQSGSIFFKLGSGWTAGTVAIGGFPQANLKFTGGTQPSPSTAANAVDRLDYIVTEGTVSSTTGQPAQNNPNTHCVYSTGVA